MDANRGNAFTALNPERNNLVQKVQKWTPTEKLWDSNLFDYLQLLTGHSHIHAEGMLVHLVRAAEQRYIFGLRAGK